MTGDDMAVKKPLIKIEQSDATVTPVLLEFLCGIGDKQEMMLARAFLNQKRWVERSADRPCR